MSVTTYIGDSQTIQQKECNVFCKHCGAKINSEAISCTGCGAATDLYREYAPAGKVTLAGIVLSYILAVLCPLLGILAGIVLLCRKDTENGIRVLVASCVCGMAWAYLLGI